MVIAGLDKVLVLLNIVEVMWNGYFDWDGMAHQMIRAGWSSIWLKLQIRTSIELICAAKS